MSFITAIEQKIKELILATGFQREFDLPPYNPADVDSEIAFEPFGKNVPAVSVAIHIGRFEKITMSKWKVKLTPSLTVLFDSKGGINEERRRAGVHPILEGVLMLLSGNDLGGICKPLEPISFKEDKIELYSQAGYIAFKVLFETSVTMVGYDPEEAAEMLKEIVLSYYLSPEDDPVADDPRVSDVISLND